MIALMIQNSMHTIGSKVPQYKWLAEGPNT